MFDSFKSAATLEKKIREWAIRDRFCLRPMSVEELREYEKYIGELCVEDLIRKSLSSILLTNHQVACSRAMTGFGGDDAQLQDNIDAFNRIQILSKKLGLRVAWIGDMPSEYDIKIFQQRIDQPR